MSSWGSLMNIFENPMSDSLSSWRQLLPSSSSSSASYDLFGELCHPSSSSSSIIHSLTSPQPSPFRRCIEPNDAKALKIFGDLCYADKDNAFPKFHGAGGDGKGEEEEIEYLRSRSANEWVKMKNDVGEYSRSYSDARQKITGSIKGGFPPPITTIGSSGKPRVYFKSIRKDGRFVLREIKIPWQRLLHATRENGRLTVRVIQPNDDQAGGACKEEVEEEKDEEEKEEGGD